MASDYTDTDRAALIARAPCQTDDIDLAFDGIHKALDVPPERIAHVFHALVMATLPLDPSGAWVFALAYVLNNLPHIASEWYPGSKIMETYAALCDAVQKGKQDGC